MNQPLSCKERDSRLTRDARKKYWKMKKIFDGAHFALFIALLLITLLLACVVVTTKAQEGRPYRVSEEQVRNLLQRLEERADAFRSIVDFVFEVSRLDGTKRENRLDLLVEEFERASDALEQRFDKHAATTADVERVLHAAERINTPLTRALADQTLHPDPSLRERAQTEWELIKASLNNLADFYNIEWKRVRTSTKNHGSSQMPPPRREFAVRQQLLHVAAGTVDQPGGPSELTAAQRESLLNHY